MGKWMKEVRPTKAMLNTAKSQRKEPYLGTAEKVWIPWNDTNDESLKASAEAKTQATIAEAKRRDTKRSKRKACKARRKRGRRAGKKVQAARQKREEAHKAQHVNSKKQ